MCYINIYITFSVVFRQLQLNNKYYISLTVQYLIEIEVVVYTEGDEVGQTLGSKMLFGDAQLLVVECTLIDP